jgi:lysophospholipase L1-like esterase
MLPMDKKKHQSWFGAAFTTLALVAGGCGSDTPDPADLLPPATTDASAVTTPEAGGSVAPAPKDAGTAVVAVQDSGGGQLPLDSGTTTALDATVTTPGSDATVSVTDGATSDGSVTAVPHMDQGKGTGSDVALVGDSWMSNTLQFEGTNGGVTPSLQAVSKQPYKNYAVQGVMLLEDDLLGKAITTQWDDAIKANKGIKTVVMTAGGNDIIQGSTELQNSCKAGTELCTTTLNKIGTTLGTLWGKMKDAGVQDIVYVLYAKSANTILKDPDGNNAAVKKVCDAVTAPARCFTVATDDLVAKTDLALDGIHPMKAANDRIAQRVFDLMVKEGMRR